MSRGLQRAKEEVIYRGNYQKIQKKNQSHPIRLAQK